MSRRRIAGTALVAALAVSACASTSDDAAGSDGAGDSTPLAAPANGEGDQATSARYAYPAPPESPASDAPNDAADDAVDRIVDGINAWALDPTAIDDLTASADPRHAWFVSDLLHFFGGQDAEWLIGSFEALPVSTSRATPICRAARGSV